jgi:excinuclease ABC subunit C
LGQLHAAAAALEGLGIVNQPLAAIAKREETIFVQGQEEEPIRLDRFSPILHLIQMIRDEAHRFAVTFHRDRRSSQQLSSALLQVPGVGEKTVRKLLRSFGSLEQLRRSTIEELAGAVNRAQAVKIHEFLGGHSPCA